MVINAVFATPVLIFPNFKFFTDRKVKYEPLKASQADGSYFDNIPDIYRDRRQFLIDPYFINNRNSGYKNTYNQYYTNRNNFFYNPHYHNNNYYKNHKLFVPNLLG